MLRMLEREIEGTYDACITGVDVSGVCSRSGGLYHMVWPPHRSRGYRLGLREKAKRVESHYECSSKLPVLGTL